MTRFTTLSGFFLFVSSLTILAMFYFVRVVLPPLDEFLKGLNVSPWFSPVTQLLLTLLGGVGVYKLIQKSIAQIWQWKVVKAWQLEHMYIEGTWVGYYSSGTESYFAVDHYRQPIGGVGVEGRGYSHDNRLSAKWRSIAVHFTGITDEGHRAQLDFLSLVELERNRPAAASGARERNNMIPTTNAATQLVFTDNERGKPTRADGYATNISDGQRFEVHLTRLSDDCKEFEKHIAAAKKFYDENQTLQASPNT